MAKGRLVVGLESSWKVVFQGTLWRHAGLNTAVLVVAVRDAKKATGSVAFLRF